MRRIREILRLCLDLGWGQSKVASSLGISSSTVNRLVLRASAAGLTWPLPPELDDTALERLLYPPPEKGVIRPEPNWAYVHEQLKLKGVTQQLLWHEYKEQHPDGLQLSQFSELYRTWRKQLNLSMRQFHRAGEKAFSDFAGAKFEITDSRSGETSPAYLFVCTLGASNYTFADAYPDQTSKSWCTAQADSFKFFRGVPESIVPDNPKAAVIAPCRYEPHLNESFAEMAKHFGCAVLPARVRRPKDKAKVEAAVNFATRWIFAKLRKRKFFSILELRQAIEPLLEALNDKPFKKLPGSRRSSYEKLDLPVLRPLPQYEYEYYDLRKTTVGIDYHIEFEHHMYSVPYQLARKEVEIRSTQNTIEILFEGNRVASHPRSNVIGSATTLNEHRPAPHQAYADRSPERYLERAAQFGPQTIELINAVLKERTHRETLNRRCEGILKLGKMYGIERIEEACAWGLLNGAVSFRSIKSILERGLDKNNFSNDPTKAPQIAIVHSNIRGANYFKSQGDNHANTTNVRRIENPEIVRNVEGT